MQNYGQYSPPKSLCYGIFHVSMIQICFQFICLGIYQFKTVFQDLFKYRILDVI